MARDLQTQNFFPIFLYLAVVIGFAITNLVLTHLPLIKPWKKTTVKDMTYESGMDPVSDARQHFDVKFYTIAILFLVFDVELLFLYPWAVAAYAETGGIPVELRNIVFVSMVTFLSIAAVAYIYEWRREGFKWR